MPKYTTFPSEENIPVLTQVEDRVEFIADLMEDMVWHRGKSAKILAKRWGLAKGTVEGNAAEASRRVTADAETVRRTITAQGAKLMMDAARSGKAKDWAVVGKLLAEVSGANAPIKQEVTIDGDMVNEERSKRLMARVFGGQASKGQTDDESESGDDSDALAVSPLEPDTADD